MNIVPVVVICLVILVYLFLICPRISRKELMIPFSKQYIAHRGLWDETAPENTLPAFRNAVNAGFGIELDVRLTADGKVVVFHDETLERVAGDVRSIEDMTFDELKGVRLFDSSEHVPEFCEALSVIKGRVPLIVELKHQKRGKELCQKTAEILDTYKGCFCIESFSPLNLLWFRMHRRDFLRGILTTGFFAEKIPVNIFKKVILENLLMNFLAYPDFVACDVRHQKQISQFICRYLFTPAIVFWTVQNEETLKKVSDSGDIFIFDSFRPESEAKKMIVVKGRKLKMD